MQNVSAQKDGEKSRVKVKVRVNTHGIFTISTASMVEKVPAEDSEASCVEADMDCPNQRSPENPDSDVSVWECLPLRIDWLRTELWKHRQGAECLEIILTEILIKDNKFLPVTGNM